MKLETKTIDVKYGTMQYSISKSHSNQSSIIYLPGLLEEPIFVIEDIHNYLIKYSSRSEIQKYHWYFPNLLGIPGSTEPTISEAHTMIQYAEDVLTMIVNEQLSSVVLVGYSMGGTIALMLMEQILTHHPGIEIKGVFWFEGNLDENDTIFTASIASKTVEEFDQEGDEFRKNAINDPNTSPRMMKIINRYLELGIEVSSYVGIERSKDLVRLSRDQIIVDIVKKHSNQPIHFLYGEENKGKYSSENIVKENGWTINYIANSAHFVFSDNRDGFMNYLFDSISY
ncbi:MAG: alpha/beta fold hydrolase [Candidatus Kariarchaeaceae archaeon]|jgi:pimeloyl-ACP methyl ester carboxylesterase